MFNFKNLSRLMDFNTNTDVLKVCVVGMKSYPSVPCGVTLLLFVKVKEHIQMLPLLQGISGFFKTGMLKHLTFLISQPRFIHVVFLQYSIKVFTGVLILIVLLFWAKNELNKLWL